MGTANCYPRDGQSVINPYAGITVPTPVARHLPLRILNTGVVKNATATLNPGVYCTGNFNIKSAATVTLQPGIYILERRSTAPVVDTECNTVTGNGVTLVFTDPGGSYPTAIPSPCHGHR